MRIVLFGLLGFLLLGGGCAGGRPVARQQDDNGSAPRSEPVAGIQEASGIARFGDDLLIVGDEDAGTFYRYPLTPELCDSSGSRRHTRSFRIPLHPEKLEQISWDQGRIAIDQESIGVLADGRIVILSERLRSLWGRDGFVAEYPPQLSETGGRGLEGLAIRPDGQGGSIVAVLWEGGYPSFGSLPEPIRAVAGRSAMNPVIVTHAVGPDETGIVVADARSMRRIELDVPRPAGGDEPTAQRFRAPDFVWYRAPGAGDDAWEFLVLLSSSWSVAPEPGSDDECPRRDGMTGEPLRYCYKWLQRFDGDGRPRGEPLDLGALLPEEIRDANWEGLSWYYGKREGSGRALVLTYERAEDELSEAYVLMLPEGW